MYLGVPANLQWSAKIYTADLSWPKLTPALKDRKQQLLQAGGNPHYFNVLLIWALCGAILAMAGDPWASLEACLSGVIMALPLESLQRIGKLISFLVICVSEVSFSAWVSLSADFLFSRLLISMMFPMISTGPVKFFFLDGRSSLAFFRYEAGAQPSLPRYLQVQKEISTHWTQLSQCISGATTKAKLMDDDIKQNLETTKADLSTEFITYWHLKVSSASSKLQTIVKSHLS